MAQAQSTSSWSPKYARPEQPLNLFVEWEAGTTFDALHVSLPMDWRLVAAEKIDDTRMKRTALSLRQSEDGWIAEGPSTMVAPLRIVLEVVPGETESLESIVVRPKRLVATTSGFLSEAVGDAIRLEVPVERARGTGGHALRLSAGMPWLTAFERAPLMFPATDSYSIEFWFETVDRDLVLLSTWNGDEAQSYPFEFVVDAGGNLRAYSGQNGMHYSAVSDRPLSDGAWHHVAYVRDVRAHLASLYVDGRAIDSVYLPDEINERAYPITIGRASELASPKISGLLDELRVWTIPRSAQQIYAEYRLPGRGLPNAPDLLLDFESLVPASVELDETVLAASDLALHQPVLDASARVRSSVVEIEWKLVSGEEQTVTVERSSDGSLFVPVYLVAAGSSNVAASDAERTYSFQDVDLAESTVFYYRFTQDFKDGSRLISNTLKVGLGDTESPTTFDLIGNSPNPFVTSTQVFFELVESMHVRLSVWDISGHLVAWLANGTLEPGLHQVAFYADDHPSGTYFVRMESDNSVTTRKMILRK